MTFRTAVRACLSLVLCLAVAGCGSSAAQIAKLKGSWTVVEVTEKGKPLPAGARYTGSMTFDGSFYEQNLTLEGDKSPTPRAFPILKGKFTVDGSKTPASIDLESESQDPGLARRGIFEFEGSRLKLCMAEPGQPRPGSLIGLSEGEMLIVLEPKK